MVSVTALLSSDKGGQGWAGDLCRALAKENAAHSCSALTCVTSLPCQHLAQVSVAVRSIVVSLRCMGQSLLGGKDISY